MRKFDKVAIVGILLLFTSFTLFSAEKHQIRKKMRKHSGEGAHGFMMFFKTLDKLNISNTQLIQLRMLFEKNKPQKEEFGKTMDFHQKLDDVSTSLQEAKEIIAQIGKKHEERMLKRFQMKQEMGKILSAKQLEQFEQQSMKGPRKKPMRRGHPGFFPPPHMAPEPMDEVEP